MKYLFITVSILFVSLFTNAQSRLFLQGNWETITTIAQQQDKDILVYHYYPMGILESNFENNIFTDKFFMDKLSSKFILYSIETHPLQRKKVFEGCELDLTPTFIFFDKHGNPLHQRYNIKTSEELLSISKDIRNPDSAYFLLKAVYEKDSMNMDLLYNYLISKSKTGIFLIVTTDFDPLAHRYFENIPESEIYSAKNWFAIKKLVFSVNDKLFDFIIANKSKFEEIYGKEVDDLIYSIAIGSFTTSPMRFQTTGDKSLYRKSKEYMLTFDTPDSKQAIEFIDSLFEDIETMSNE